MLRSHIFYAFDSEAKAVEVHETLVPYNDFFVWYGIVGLLAGKPVKVELLVHAFLAECLGVLGVYLAFLVYLVGIKADDIFGTEFLSESACKVRLAAAGDAPDNNEDWVLWSVLSVHIFNSSITTGEKLGGVGRV